MGQELHVSHPPSFVVVRHPRSVFSNLNDDKWFMLRIVSAAGALHAMVLISNTGAISSPQVSSWMTASYSLAFVTKVACLGETIPDPFNSRVE